MIDSLVTAFRAPDIRRKILFTLGILFIFRVLTNVPVAERGPGTALAAVRVEPAARPARPLLGRRTGDRVDHRHGREPVHQRQHHHAADAGGDPQPRRAGPGRRVRAESAEPVHPPADRANGVRPGLRLQRPAGGQRRDPAEPVLQLRDAVAAAQLDGRHHPAHVAGRADQRARPGQRHQLHHLRRHRRPHPAPGGRRW